MPPARRDGEGTSEFATHYPCSVPRQRTGGEAREHLGAVDIVLLGCQQCVMERRLARCADRSEQVVGQTLIDLRVTGPFCENGVGALTRQRRQRVGIRRGPCAEPIEASGDHTTKSKRSSRLAQPPDAFEAAAQHRKVTFSDGAGNTVAPTGHPGFPIAAGKTDFVQLLKAGPVMVGDGQNPAHWMLATQMTADGKGIVANDPVSSKQIVLSYHPATNTVGGVTGVLDSDKKTFVSLANALANPSADAHLSTLQSFVPAGFLAVTVK
jgi:hypothetical protein